MVCGWGVHGVRCGGSETSQTQTLDPIQNQTGPKELKYKENQCFFIGSLALCTPAIEGQTRASTPRGPQSKTNRPEELWYLLTHVSALKVLGLLTRVSETICFKAIQVLCVISFFMCSSNLCLG